MNDPDTPMLQAAFFHEESRAVRFWVDIDGVPMGAIISERTLHHGLRPGAKDDAPLDTYRSFERDIHAAVRRRVAQGSIEPVMLRESDLRVAS